MLHLKCWWRAAVAASLLGFQLSRVLAAEYGCAAINAANVGGKTIWLYPPVDRPIHFAGWEGRGYSSIVLGAGGTYTVNASNAAFARSGTWTAENGVSGPFTWVDIWLNNFPESGETTKFVAFNTCGFELEKWTPVFANIYEGVFRVTDGAPPTPQPPTAVTILGGGTSEVGAAVILSAQANGDTPFTFVWSGPGGVIPWATGASLALTNAQLADSGSYTCVVANAYGTNSASTTVTVIPGTAPFITADPQSRTNNPGNSFMMTVTAGGSVPRYYQWRKEGIPLTAETNSYLYLASFAATNVGNYDVVVTNNFGAITSAVAVLTLYTGPVITSLTPHQDITNGQPFTLTVTATGDQPMFYAWFRNGAAVSGATNTSYSTNGGNLTGGAYTVRVMNPSATVTSAVTYVVSSYPDKAWPSIARDTNYTSVASLVVTQGQSLRLVGIAGGPMPIAFNWRKDGTNIPGFTSVAADAVSYNVSGTYATRYSFFNVSNAQAEMAGAYTVATTNPFGMATSSVANVTVLLTNPPVLLTQPTNRVLYLGTTLSVGLSLTYASSFASTVSWYSNNVLMPGLTGSNAVVSISTNGVFTFRGVVSNAYGSVTTSNAVVTVKYGDGRLDDFAPPANFNNAINALVPLPDGGVMVGSWLFTQFGSTNVQGVAIVNPDGSLNFWRAATNSNVNPLTSVLALHRYPNGQVLVGGFFSRVGQSPGRQYSGLLRLNADGTVDTNFLAGWDSVTTFFGTAQGIGVKSIDVAPDGTIAVGGNFTTVSNTLVYGLAFFEANGQFKDSQRPNFSPADISVVKFQPDGKLLVGGNFTTVNASPAGQRVRLARLNTNGTVDTNFFGGTNIFAGAMKSLALDAGGNIYAGGAINATGRRGIVRLFPNGGVDTNFVSKLSNGNEVSTIQLQADGRVIIGGSFSHAGAYRLARLETNGTVDASFPGGGIFPSSGGVNSMGFAPNGRLWIGGSFFDFANPAGGGFTRPYLARLEFFPEASVVTTPPLLGLLSWGGNNFGFAIPTLPGASYRIEYKTNLADLDWQLYQSFTATSAVQNVSIPPAPPGSSSALVRLRELTWRRARPATVPASVRREVRFRPEYHLEIYIRPCFGRNDEANHPNARIRIVKLAFRALRGPALNRDPGRRCNLQAEPFPVLLQPGGSRASGLDGRRRYHSPTDGGVLRSGRDRVLDRHLVRGKSECAQGALQFVGIGRRQVNGGVPIIGRVRETRDGRPAGDDLLRSVHHQRAVPLVMIAEQTPALCSLLVAPEVETALLQIIVFLHPQIQRPTLSHGVQNEGTDIQMGMAGRRGAGFHGQEQRVRVGPGTAESSQRILAFATPVQASRLLALHSRFAPKQDQREIPVARFAAAALLNVHQILLQQLLLKPEQVRAARPRCKPHHRRRKPGAHAAIAERIGPARRADDVQHELSGRHEPGRRAQPKVAAKNRFQHRDQHHVERGAVVPIPRPFRIRAIRIIHLHRRRQPCQSPADHFRRLLRIVFQQRERPAHHAGVADLVPIVPALFPAVPLFRRQLRRQPFALNRVPKLLPQIGGQAVEHPVISHGHRQRHFADIQEVRGIPIRHRRHRPHLGQQPVSIALVARHAVSKSQVDASTQGFPRPSEQPTPVLPVFDRLLCKHVIRGFPHRVPDRGHLPVVAHFLLHRRFLVLGPKQTRMVRGLGNTAADRFQLIRIRCCPKAADGGAKQCRQAASC